MSTENTKKAQEERAKKLRQQISKIKEGKFSDPTQIGNPRDFIAEKMRVIDEEKQIQIEQDPDENAPE